MGRRPASVVLSDSDRAQLERWARSRTVEARLRERALIVLHCAEGESNEEIADTLGIVADTVSKWRHRFLRHGVEGLEDAPRSGRPPTITPGLERLIVEETLTPPKHRTHWSTRSMAKRMGVSDSTVRTIWKRHDLKPHIVRKFKLSKDPAFVEKVEDIVGLYLNPPENAFVFSVDEKSQIQALDRSRPILPIRPGLPEHQTHDYKRHGTTTLFAALNVATGRVLSQFQERHRHQEFIEFLEEIDAHTPKGLDVHVIIDNSSTHKTPEVDAWLATHDRFTMHFTPTGSSWINMVERVFSKVTDERIRRGAFRSVEELEAAIQAWLDNHNENPQPFKWVKTAGEIIQKVEKYRRTYSALH